MYFCIAMKYQKIEQKVLSGVALSAGEALRIYRSLPTPDLMLLAQQVRQRLHPGNTVSWIIDRNINITNVCVSACSFCSFHCHIHDQEKAFITDTETYKKKIEELFKTGGRQLLLQGGMHPDLQLNYYEQLFTELKTLFPSLKLHALGPAEIIYLSKTSGLSTKKVLVRLMHAGLDSLPGAGAEILVDGIRQKVAPNKCSVRQWIHVMRQAHKLKLPTTATMMFGHIENLQDRMTHLSKIRQLQSEKPSGSLGFTAFIPWTFQAPHTALIKAFPKIEKTSTDSYLRTIAISRIFLNNIKNIQASWLTAGKEAATMALSAGANDLGSIMIEENVVAASGVKRTMSVRQMQKLIKEAGFIPQQRDQLYNPV